MCVQVCVCACVVLRVCAHRVRTQARKSRDLSRHVTCYPISGELRGLSGPGGFIRVLARAGTRAAVFRGNAHISLLIPTFLRLNPFDRGSALFYCGRRERRGKRRAREISKRTRGASSRRRRQRRRGREISRESARKHRACAKFRIFTQPKTRENTRGDPSILPKISTRSALTEGAVGWTRDPGNYRNSNFEILPHHTSFGERV